jgi:hypothetical protein
MSYCFKAGSNVYSISKVVDSQSNKSDLNGNEFNSEKRDLPMNVYEIAKASSINYVTLKSGFRDHPHPKLH